MRQETRTKLDGLARRDRNRRLAILGLIACIGLLPVIARLALPPMPAATWNAIQYGAGVASLLLVSGWIASFIISWMIWGFRVRPTDVFAGWLVGNGQGYWEATAGSSNGSGGGSCDAGSDTGGDCSH